MVEKWCSTIRISDGGDPARPNKIIKYIFEDRSHHLQVVTLLHILQGTPVPIYSGFKTIPINQPLISLLQKAWYI